LANEAIILAAGYGSRLAELSSSKPLACVLGVSLIEISVRQLSAAGVERIVVVAGHDAERVENELRRLEAEVGVTIEPVRVDDWSRPNGWSVIAGARKVCGPFLLVMADHIFGNGLLSRLAEQSLDRCDAILATDHVDNPLVDPEDATWVGLRENGEIDRIGKSLAEYDRVDCGAFLANQKLPAAIEEAIASGKGGSLSEGMQVLADRARAQTMDVAGSWWIDVDDPRAHSLAESEIADHLALFAREAVDA